ncbi:probable cytochrome P450 6a23 [Planococcus citri]|uniref:probable cytochrome P450 6a23 n=1 Tax=Planococcus citri TaxID=170843 RepID=UPI0031F786CA
MDTSDLIIAAILLLFVYLYFSYKNLYSYFEKNDVPYVKPLPFFGNTFDWIAMKKSLPMIQFDMYNQLAPHRFGGMFVGTKKTVLIRDPELIRTILVKDFSYFQNRHLKSNKSDILSQNLFMMRGEEWKNLRIKMTSTFTSGKMKLMFPLVRECGTKLHTVLEEISNKDDFYVKDICARFTTDVIGSCAFGLEINSLDDPDSVFRKMGNKVFEISYINILRFMFPKLQNFFNLFRNNNDVSEFFLGLVQKTVKHREEHKVVRRDFLDLLINLKNETDSHKTDDHQTRQDLEKFISQIGGKHTASNVDMTVELMAAQSFLFFVAGFETSSSTLSFMLLELAQNQHVQDKLRDEIIQVLENNDNEFTYEAMKQMKYLDMVIDETLRKFPITGSLGRECDKPYKIPGSKFVIPEGTTTSISIRGIHYDSKYYERPDEFYPEHFTEEAKAKRPHYTFLPFGEGPRVCIGERFAKMQVKVGAVNLLKDFSYHVSPKLKLPVEHSPGVGLFDIKGGIWLKCTRI